MLIVVTSRSLDLIKGHIFLRGAMAFFPAFGSRLGSEMVQYPCARRAVGARVHQLFLLSRESHLTVVHMLSSHHHLAVFEAAAVSSSVIVLLLHFHSLFFS